MQIHVFSDASHCRTKSGGAYIVGDGQPVHVKFDAANSTEAELLTLESAVRAARALHPEADLVVHTDLQSIPSVLVNLRARGAMKLRDAIAECKAEILTDANSHAQHQICHRHSRIASGLRRPDQPAATTQKTKYHNGSNTKPVSGGKQSATAKKVRRRVVLEALIRIGRAATEHELGRACCLPPGVVVTTMNWLGPRGFVRWTPAGWIAAKWASEATDLDAAAKV
jgi:hypothetical protein